MAKSTASAAVADEEARGAVVALRGGSAPPAVMNDLLQETAGQGVSKDQADNLVPLIYILQDGSPQAKSRDKDNYIEGAEPGFIWLRNAPDPVVAGDVGIEVIPCFFSKDVVEWKPRDDGGGFIARHDFQPGEDIDKLAARLGASREVDDKNPNRVVYVMRNGNELVETRYHVVFVVRDHDHLVPFVIPLSSTGHTFSRGWMFKYNSKILDNGTTAASYACVYRLKTRLRKNASGEWFQFEENDGSWLWDRFRDEPGSKEPLTDAEQAKVRAIFMECRALHEAFAKGLKQPDMPETEAAGGSTAEAERHI